MEEQKYYLIPADFELFSFKEIKVENDTRKELLWHSQSWHKEEDGEWKDKNYNYERGSIVYFYYKNLPDLTSRIVMRGIITDINREDEGWFFGEGDEKEKKPCKCIVVTDLKPVLLDNEDKYSANNISKEYGLNTVYRQQLANQRLIEDLENDYDKNASIDTIVEYFNKKMSCECCEILGFNEDEKRKRTIIKRNGIMFREIHHLLMQNITRKSESFKQSKYLTDVNTWIDNNFNKVVLCPLCHEEFHHGDFVNVEMSKKQIIDKLIQNKNYKNNLIEKCSKTEEQAETIIEYIYAQYNVFEE